MSGFELEHVIPDPMADVEFDKNSVWNNSVQFQKNHSIVLAPSGSGKTSLHAFMYGTRFNYQGQIKFNGEPLKNIGLRKWSTIRQNHLSVIFQDLRLLPHLTVEENLILKNKLTNYKTTEQIKLMVEKLGIIQKWNQPCKTLSFGQQQRVAIVRSLLQPFEYLLADEPFSHIDDNNIEKAKALIFEECKEKNASLLLFSLGNEYGINFDKKYYL